MTARCSRRTWMARCRGRRPTPETSDRINLNVNIGKNPNQNDQNMKGGIDEIQIYNRDLTAAKSSRCVFAGGVASFARAVAPDPADGANGGGHAHGEMDWGARGRCCMRSTSAQTRTLRRPTSAESQALTMYYHAPGTAPGQTYYWRIDEVTADGTKTTGKGLELHRRLAQSLRPKASGRQWVMA